eukprot:scaffold22272_cov66-Phaeocystis_antarctica.AAC.3
MPPTHKLNGSSLGRPGVDLMFAQWAFNIVRQAGITSSLLESKSACNRSVAAAGSSPSPLTTSNITAHWTPLHCVALPHFSQAHLVHMQTATAMRSVAASNGSSKVNNSGDEWRQGWQLA